MALGSAANPEIKQADIRLNSVDTKRNPLLPDSYTCPCTVALKTTSVSVPLLVNESASK